MTQQNFLSNESGAVTVDWVVLTAALVGLGLAVMGVMSSGLENQSTQVATQLSDGSIIRTAFTGDASAAQASACSGYSGCDASLSASALQQLSTADLNAIADVTDGTDYGNAMVSAGYSMDTDGNWVDSNGVVDQTVTDNFNSAYAYEQTTNELLAAERAARAN